MSDKNLNNKKKKPTAPVPNPRPGLQLWVLAGLLVFLFGVMWVNNLNSPAKINQQRFESMLAAGDVQAVTIISNQKMVEVTPNTSRSSRAARPSGARGWARSSTSRW
jgi:AFG3 family protein